MIAEGANHGGEAVHDPLAGAAVVLAGGASERMGRDKALLEVDGETLLERALRGLATMFRETLVSVGAAGPSAQLSVAVERFERFSEQRVPVVADLVDRGPLAGIHSVLNATEWPALFVIAVDLPQLFPPLIHQLWRTAHEPGAIGCIPVFDGRAHPTYAVYRGELQPALEQRLSDGNLRAQGLAEISGVEILDLDEEREQEALLGETSPADRVALLHSVFCNLNSPADYDRWRKQQL